MELSIRELEGTSNEFTEESENQKEKNEKKELQEISDDKAVIVNEEKAITETGSKEIIAQEN